MKLLLRLKTMLKRMLGGYGCRDTARLLYAFAEGELDPVHRKKLEAHLGDCHECLEFLETYRKTIALTHSHDLPSERDMPPRLREKLLQFIDDNPQLS
jgi:anti-sigma factor RsiW